MRLYRALEFSKLVFLLDEQGQQLWDEHLDAHAGSGKKTSNWWLEQKAERGRREIVSRTCSHAHDAFFSKSLEFNAMRGGRFNPGRSFGVLYAANSPAIAALEVLYHLFVESYPTYTGMKSKSSQIGACFNVRVPDKMEVLIVVFEVACDYEKNCASICDDDDGLQLLCEKIGFSRYLGKSFSRDFIFGNDYEIANILGCHLHTQKTSSFLVPSARIDFSLQDDLKLRNFVLMEKDVMGLAPTLTGKFLEYKCSVEMHPKAKAGHKVTIEACGQTSVTETIWLQHNPSRKLTPDQIRMYSPDVTSAREKRLYSREVQIQKFHLPNADDQIDE